MIKLSEMYRISGGCTPSRTCSECADYIGGKELTCLIYPKDYGMQWEGSRMACKYFRERVGDGQMDIGDLFREARGNDKGEIAKGSQAHSV